LIKTDVEAEQNWVKAAGPLACVKLFVGHSNTKSLTRKAFLYKVERLLSDSG